MHVIKLLIHIMYWSIILRTAIGTTMRCCSAGTLLGTDCIPSVNARKRVM